MRWRTFMIGWTMALAVLLLVHSQPATGDNAVGTAVVEFTYAGSPRSARKHPAEAARARRVLAPLVVLNVTSETRSNPAYLVTMDDVARWEEVHGHIPSNAVVMARSAAPTMWRSQPSTVTARAGNAGRFPGFGEDAIRFLVEARYAYGLGTETPEKGRSVVLVYRPPA
jgi:hypothetical protein